MSQHAFSDTPHQVTQLQSDYPEIVNEGIFGVTQNWDVPLALWRARDGFDTSYAGHEHHTLSFLLKGAACERMDGRFAGRRGVPDSETFMLYADSQPRRYVARGDVQICQMYFQPSFFKSIASQEENGSGRVIELRDDRVFARDRHLREMTDFYLARAFDTSRRPSTLEMDARAILMGVHLLQHHSSRALPYRAPRGGLGSRRVTAALEYIEARLREDISLADIAAAVGLSPRHFCTAFRISVGKTPHVYLTERRIERAKLLLAGSMPLAEIALECAFGSQQHFTTAFRNHTGFTPAYWRRNPAL